MSWLSNGWLDRRWKEFRRSRYQALGDDEDFLLVTWDSCRYDAYLAAKTPVLDRHADVVRSWAMATYTLPAHQAMFSGFLPHAFEPLPFYNRYQQQLWRISHRNVHTKPLATFPERTENVVAGFRRRGYFTVGVAALDWFARPSVLQNGFERLTVTGTAARRQNQILIEQIAKKAARRPCFAFANYGETHSPFRFERMTPAEETSGENFSLARLFNQSGPLHDDHPFDEVSFRKQVACAEYLDARMGELIEFFGNRGAPTTVVVCADHGECFGEQGLYGHAFYHEKVMEVPLLIFRLNAAPHASPVPSHGAKKAA